MRHIPILSLLAEIYQEESGAKARQRLFNAHKRLARMPHAKRARHLKRNGPSKWLGIKKHLIAKCGRKCWYTEVELTGAPLTIDHYRPKRDYWWLAFDPENFRVACPYSNSPEHNAEHGCAGGKGDEFPVCGRKLKAKGRKKLKCEEPLILDPCKSEDCRLVAFQADGLPILHPDFANDATAAERLKASKLLLNLDHPDFNAKRHQLYLDIDLEVRIYNALLPANNLRNEIRDRMLNRLKRTASFSSAARYYLQFHRDHAWVEALLQDPEV